MGQLLDCAGLSLRRRAFCFHTASLFPRTDHPLGRKKAGESAAPAHFAFDLEIAAVALEYVFGDSQSQSGAARFTGAPCVDAVKSFAEAGYVTSRDALSGVADREAGSRGITAPGELDEAAPGCVPYGVQDQIGKTAVQFLGIASQP